MPRLQSGSRPSFLLPPFLLSLFSLFLSRSLPFLAHSPLASPPPLTALPRMRKKDATAAALRVGSIIDRNLRRRRLRRFRSFARSFVLSGALRRAPRPRRPFARPPARARPHTIGC